MQPKARQAVQSWSGLSSYRFRNSLFDMTDAATNGARAAND